MLNKTTRLPTVAMSRARGGEPPASVKFPAPPSYTSTAFAALTRKR